MSGPVACVPWPQAIIAALPDVAVPIATCTALAAGGDDDSLPSGSSSGSTAPAAVAPASRARICSAVAPAVVVLATP